jgi:hypothetical protein
VASYRLTVRNGPRVERARYRERGAALAAVESRGRALERDASAAPVGGRVLRRMAPQQQVVARLELAGPGRLRVGVDVRGDGSSEAWTGRLRRRLVEQGRGESPYDALRRVSKQ